MDFEQIEDALLTELTDLTYLETLETYGGQLEGNIESLPINYPAVFAVFDGAPLNWVDGPNFSEEDTFTILCCASDVRGNHALRKDIVTGCYRMIKDVLKTLSGKNLGLDIYPLQPLRVYPVLITKTLAIYGVKFKTNFDSTY
jgi:phage gp37-like protein